MVRLWFCVFELYSPTELLVAMYLISRMGRDERRYLCSKHFLCVPMKFPSWASWELVHLVQKIGFLLVCREGRDSGQMSGKLSGACSTHLRTVNAPENKWPRLFLKQYWYTLRFWFQVIFNSNLLGLHFLLNAFIPNKKIELVSLSTWEGGSAFVCFPAKNVWN